ncbi:hypothetical protein DLAC_06101 [Tieghemostelium lacteum]|uniref:Uncharacterized protein n=1 Tax=Tieghemostelium lacteum TaxID=361077 RepID=A0A151ZHH7_TIELA|nr:hypothetical protein DLAC_06101 [Tieghemostelium lacteum]|eukprot:KYQ93413.1 hypothetical protein DLAC_06101 [Tieghemostelium lacteum]
MTDPLGTLNNSLSFVKSIYDVGKDIHTFTHNTRVITQVYGHYFVYKYTVNNENLIDIVLEIGYKIGDSGKPTSTFTYHYEIATDVKNANNLFDLISDKESSLSKVLKSSLEALSNKLLKKYMYEKSWLIFNKKCQKRIEAVERDIQRIVVTPILLTEYNIGFTLKQDVTVYTKFSQIDKDSINEGKKKSQALQA